MIIRRISFSLFKRFLFRFQRYFSQEKKQLILEPQIPLLLNQKTRQIDETYEIDADPQQEQQEILESQQTVFTDSVLIERGNLQQMLNNFNQFPSTISLTQQVCAIQLIYDQLSSIKRLTLKQKLLLGACALKIKYDEVSLLEQSQFQLLLNFIVFLKKGKLNNQLSNLQTRLYTQFISKISKESFGDMPIYKISELYLKFSFLYSVKKKYLTEVPNLLLEKVFSGNVMGVDLQTVLNILQGIYNFDHFFFQERCLVNNILKLLLKNYDTMYNLDRLKLVSFLLQFDIQRYFSLYLSIQVSVLDKFISDLKLNVFNYDEELLYLIIDPKYRYNNLNQRKIVQNHLMSHLLAIFNSDGSRNSYSLSLKVVFNFISQYVKRHKFNEFSVQEKQKFVNIMSIRTKEYFKSKLEIYTKFIKYDYFQDGEKWFVNDLKKGVQLKMMQLSSLYEISKLGVVIEPMVMAIIQSKCKKTMMLQYRTNGLINQMKMILIFKIQERLQPKEIYYQGLADEKYLEFQTLIFSNIDKYIASLVKVQSNLLIEFSIEMNLVDSLLTLQNQLKDLPTNKKQIMYLLILRTTKNPEIMLYGKPIYKYISGASLYRLMEKQDMSKSQFISTPLLKSIYFYFLKIIQKYKKDGGRDYNFIVMKYIYNFLNKTTIAMTESLKDHSHQLHFEIYWKILCLLVDYIDILQKIPNCSHKFKSVLQYLFQHQPNLFSICFQYREFVKKSLKLLSKINHNTIPINKIMATAFQSKIINQTNWSDYNIVDKGNQKHKQFSILAFLNYFQDSEKIEIVNNLQVFSVIKSKQILTMQQIAKIIQYFKECKSQKIYIIVLSLFNLPCQYNYSRTFFYIWRRLIKNCSQNSILGFNIYNLLENINKYLPGLQFNLIQYQETKLQLSNWISQVVNLYFKVYKELPLNYFMMIVNIAILYDWNGFSDLQSVLLASLLKPYQTLKGKIYIFDTMIKLNIKFSEQQIKNVIQNVLMPYNMDKIELMHFLNPKKQTSRYSLYKVDIDKNPYSRYKQIWKLNRGNFNMNDFSRLEVSHMGKDTFVFVLCQQLLVLTVKSDFMGIQKNQRKNGFAQSFNIQIDQIEEIRLQKLYSQDIRKSFQEKFKSNCGLTQRQNKLINFFIEIFGEQQTDYQISRQFEQVKPQEMTELQMQQLLRQNERLRSENDIL